MASAQSAESVSQPVMSVDFYGVVNQARDQVWGRVGDVDVGFDGFFSFADHFGSNLGEEKYNPKVDIDKNGGWILPITTTFSIILVRD